MGISPATAGERLRCAKGENEFPSLGEYCNMRKLISIAAVALFAAACQDAPNPAGPQPYAATLSASTDGGDPKLAAALASAGANDKLEVIVNFDEASSTSTAVAKGVTGTGAGVVTFKYLPMVGALATPAQIASIKSLPGVRSVYFNARLQFLNYEATRSTNADDVWALGYTGTGVGVAILDSGIDGLYNPGLKYPTKTIANAKYIADFGDIVTYDETLPRFQGKLFVENVANSETSVGHGTHVAGTVGGDGSGSSAGIYKGVAPGANLIGIGTGDVLFIFWALAGFDYVLDHQAQYNIQVVNNSWGSSASDFDPENPINIATKKVHDAGVTVVFAAGNDGPDQNTLNPYSVAPWVISVAAGCKLFVTDPTTSADHCADQTGAGRPAYLADFSSRGVPNDPMLHPDIMAPGVHIASTRASTGTVLNALDANHDARICNISLQHQQYFTCASGTSMASPHVAGIVALMEQASGGKLTPDQALNLLTKTATRLPDFGLWEVGAGHANALAAVKAAKALK